MYKSKYANLMQHLMNEHDLILLDSEQQEIEKWLDKDLKAINYTRGYNTFDSLLERLQELNEIKRPYFKWNKEFKKSNRIAWEGKEDELQALVSRLEKELNVL